MRITSTSLGQFVLAAVLAAVAAGTADARITRIVIEHRDSPAYKGQSFGEAGRYEWLTGHAYGELDPKDPLNAIITDLHSRRGMRAAWWSIRPRSPWQSRWISRRRAACCSTTWRTAAGSRWRDRGRRTRARWRIFSSAAIYCCRAAGRETFRRRTEWRPSRCRWRRIRTAPASPALCWCASATCRPNNHAAADEVAWVRACRAAPASLDTPARPL